METITISKTYNLKWQIDNTCYKVSNCGKVFNCKRGKEIKRIINGGSIGFCLNGKFETLASVRKRLKVIKASSLPF